jgi:hypothetical protein
MVSKQTYYCWIRLLKVDNVASMQARDALATSPPPIRMEYWHRPPWAARSLDRTASDDHDAWSAERCIGKPKSEVIFQCGPAYRSRTSALSWLQSREGESWAVEAENFMLMNFEREPASAALSLAPKPQEERT